jgi:UDP-glucose 4-epimerase
MKIIVTGGAGFIGSNLVDRLVLEGNEVAVIDNYITGSKLNRNREAIYYEISILDEKISEIFENFKPEAVIHLAAQVSVKHSIMNPKFDANSNILGTISLLEHCVRHDVSKFILASTAAVYGNPIYLGIDEKHPLLPISQYGVSKLSAERYTMLYSDIYGINYCILRYANVYGIKQRIEGEGGVVSIFINNLLNKSPIVIYGDGTQTRDFIYVDDVVSANIAALESGRNGIYNISTGKPTSVNELVQMLTTIAGIHHRLIYKPSKIGDISHSYLDNTLAIKELAWRPENSIQQGLEKTFHWYKTNIKVLLTS